MHHSPFLRRVASIVLTLAMIIVQLGAYAPAPVLATGSFSPAVAPLQSRADAVVPQATSPEWHTETVDLDPGAGEYVSAIAGDAGSLFVGYSQQTAGTYSLMLAEGSTGSWATSIVESRDSLGTHNSIALDDAGNPHLTYYSITDTALRYAYRDGTRWTRQTIDNSADVGAFSSLVYSPGDKRFHVSYADLTNRDLKYLSQDRGTWGTPLVVDAAGSVGRHTSIALRVDTPRISYHSGTEDSLRYAVSTASGWQTSTVNKPGAGGEYTSMALNAFGYERVVYSRGGTGVRFAYRDGRAWYDTEVYRSSSPRIPTALAIGADDIPHIVFVADGMVYYATTHPREGWALAVVDDAGAGGETVSIVLDAIGHPHIFYHSTTGGLVHAWYEPLPDLVVTDIWPQDGQVWFQVRNIGKATAPGRHKVELYVDDALVGNHGISDALPPGERYTSWIAWSCAGAEHTLRLEIDVDEAIMEANEDNNTRTETWQCDTTPPLLSRPIISEVGTNHVVITWNTDEPATGRVYHAANAAIMTRFVDDPNLPGTSHSVTISGLMPGKTYRYRVESTDLAGNTASSREGFFETAGIPVTLPQPTLGFSRVSDQYMVYELSVSLDELAAQADSSVKPVKSVTFYVTPRSADGTPLREYLVGTSYTPRLSPMGSTVYTLSTNLGLLGLTDDEYMAPVFDVRAELTTIDDVVHTIVEPRPAPEWDQHPIEAFIITPGPDQVFYGDENGAFPPGTEVLISVEAIEFEQSCTYSPELRVGGMYVSTDCRDVATFVQEVEIYVDGYMKSRLTSPVPNTYQYEYMLDISQLDPGVHTLRATIRGTDDWTNVQHLEQTFSIEAVVPDPILPAPLNVERTVTRNGTYFDVELSISLPPGQPPVTLYELRDWVREFVPVNKTALNYQIYVGTYPLGTSGKPARSGQVTVDFYNGYVLSSSETLTVRYTAVPILHEDGNLDAAIGSYPIWLEYEKEGNTFVKYADRPWQDNGLVQTAIGSSDYIMVTNPSRLSGMPDPQWLPSLYGSMAKLASLRNGVLGFLDTYDTATLDDLLEPNGYWFESLHPAFRTWENNGYVLIVGESEIVPAFTQTAVYYYSYWPTLEYEIHVVADYSDQRYASTGGDMHPELNLGRVLGFWLKLLRATLETSIAHAEGRPEHQYTADGPAIVFASPTETRFEEDAIDIAVMMDSVGVDALRISLPETNPGSVLKALIDDGYSIIHLRGHGSPASWDGGLNTVDAWSNLSFGDYSPFVFATTCLTGRYPGWGLAETVMYRGAAVYIGATEESLASLNRSLSLAFYRDYWDVSSGEPVGRTFARLERDTYSTSDYKRPERNWVLMYNLYGDPRFGAAGPHNAPASVVEAAALALPAATHQVLVPGYEVAATPEGLDAVTIPGGRIVLETGLPQVPYWVETLVYPAGARVQDVTLTSRQGCTSGDGYALPVTTDALDSGPAVTFGLATALAIEDDEWLPGLDDIYRWEVIDHPDGSSRLEITINPFHYQAATTNYQWCDDFAFDIDVLVTDVSIDTFALDNGFYNAGDLVAADLWVTNPGAPEDVVMLASIAMSGAPDIAFDGLEIGGLPGVEGDGHYALSWDSAEAPPGDYLMNVYIYNLEGTLLQSASRTFALGAPMAQVTALSATPSSFVPGASIQLSTTVQNTGPVPISGDVIIEVIGLDTADVVQTHTEPVAALAPAATHVMNRVWDTTGADQASYQVRAYMHYASKVTNIETRTVINRELTSFKVYLPLVTR